MAEVEVKPCANPGCDQLGTKICSACKITIYCCVTCQTADWAHHKEECPGHLRKMGKANLEKARGFYRDQNWMQALRYAEIAATKLKQLKDRRIENVEAIDDALGCKYNALGRMDRHREALECIKECYTLWAMNHMRNKGSLRAALSLIQSCLHNNEFEDAESYARHAYFMIAEMTDNFLSVDERPVFLADGSYWLARTIFYLVKSGGIPPAEKKKAGEEAIELARKALEIHTQLFGTESCEVATDINALADTLDFFNNVDDNEVPRLFKQAIAIYRQVQGSSSYNVAVCEKNLGISYGKRADRAQAANDLDRCMVNLEVALPHYCEAARIFRAINLVDRADEALRDIAEIEGKIRQTRIARATAAAASKG